MLRVSVVICAHTARRWDDLLRAVHSVQNQTASPSEVVIVVDHNDLLLRRIRDEISGVVVIPNTGTPGLGGARNSGIAAATGDIVAFLDDDARASAGWLEAMLHAYENSDVSGVGGSIEPVFDGSRPPWFPSEFDWVIGCTYRGLPTGPTPVRNLFGANMSFRRSVFDAVGQFRLGYGCDETELCIRLRQRMPGWILLFDPDMCVGHRVPSNRVTWRYFLRRCFFEGGSKAVVSHLRGASDGLQNERDYTRRVLPAGVKRNMGEALRGDIGGLGRALAIVAGLAATTAGYAAGLAALDRAAARRGWTGQLSGQEA